MHIADVNLAAADPVEVNFVLGLRCVICGTMHPARVAGTCLQCGIGGILDVVYDYTRIRGRLTRAALAARPGQDHWRYRELLPISSDTPLPALSVGGTPLTDAPALAHHLGVERLLLKDDGRNPTASLKDRPSSLGAALAAEGRFRIVSCASTGNAASSLAGMAASLAASRGLRSVIFVPERAPAPKITQLLIFGATVIRVQGSYEDAFQLCQQSCERYGWYNRNAAINPYLVEGKKTAGLEVGEQMNWEPPDWVAVSVGDGCTIAGIWKAFREMRTIGLTARVPRMLGVQAEGAAPVTTAFRTGRTLQPIVPETLADSIAVGVPRNWRKAVQAIQESGGTMVNVSDGQILEAMRTTGRLTGIFAEPAASAAVAGVDLALREGIVDRASTVVAMITGNGLKDISGGQAAVGQPFDVPPDGAGLETILESRGLRD